MARSGHERHRRHRSQVPRRPAIVRRDGSRSVGRRLGDADAVHPGVDSARCVVTRRRDPGRCARRQDGRRARRGVDGGTDRAERVADDRRAPRPLGRSDPAIRGRDRADGRRSPAVRLPHPRARCPSGARSARGPKLGAHRGHGRRSGNHRRLPGRAHGRTGRRARGSQRSDRFGRRRGAHRGHGVRPVPVTTGSTQSLASPCVGLEWCRRGHRRRRRSLVRLRPRHRPHHRTITPPEMCAVVPAQRTNWRIFREFRRGVRGRARSRR